MSEQQYYVVSVHHTKRADRYITLWNPDNKGYCYRTSVAGKYSESEIAAHLGYYHNGYDNVAVKCEVLDAIVTASQPGFLDVPGPVVPNTAGSWLRILDANTRTWPTERPPKPQYKGARRQKEKA